MKKHVEFGSARVCESVKREEAKLRVIEAEIQCFREEYGLYMDYRAGKMRQKDYADFKMRQKDKWVELRMADCMEG